MWICSGVRVKRLASLGWAMEMELGLGMGMGDRGRLL